MFEKYRKTISSIAFFFLLSTAMAGIQEKDLSFFLKEKRIQQVTSTGLILAFYMNITNSSSKSQYLARYDYRFLVNQKEYLRLETTLPEPIEIKPGESATISLPVKITYSLLFQAIPQVEKEDKANCHLFSSLIFWDERKKEKREPLALSGEFPIFRNPEVEFLPLKIIDLTIGGAEAVFEAKFKNMNNFDLIVSRIRFRLEMGGKLIAEGELGGDKNIGQRGEKILPLPLLLDFFEIGNDIYLLLQQPAVPCRFRGEMEILSAWGELLISFDKSESLPISRS